MAKNAMNSEEIVLNYYDCLIRSCDVRLLQGPHWINDVLIGFYFEYLDEKFNQTDKKDLLFVSPELTQLLKMTSPAEYGIFLNPIGAVNSKFIFFPLNNCDSKDAAGGTHWSLMVYSEVDKTCYHFDSCRAMNNDIACDFAKNLTNYLLGDKENRMIEMDSPQQDNGYDCGLFVLCFTDALSEYIVVHSRIAGCDYSTVKKSVTSKRLELLDLIDVLRRRKSK